MDPSSVEVSCKTTALKVAFLENGCGMLLDGGVALALMQYRSDFVSRGFDGRVFGSAQELHDGRL